MYSEFIQRSAWGMPCYNTEFLRTYCSRGGRAVRRTREGDMKGGGPASCLAGMASYIQHDVGPMAWDRSSGKVQLSTNRTRYCRKNGGRGGEN